MKTRNLKSLDVGYLPTETPAHFLHVSVNFHDKRGYFCTVNAVELEISGTGFACTKFGMFDGGMNTFKVEDAARFSAKRLTDIALDLGSGLALKNPSDALLAAIVKSCSAKGLVVAKDAKALTKVAAFATLSQAGGSS